MNNQAEIDILQRGNIYFFVRPKIDTEIKYFSKDETQKLEIVLNPDSSNKFVLLIIGKKELPRGSGKSYFCLVAKIFTQLEFLLEDLKEKHYQTKTSGEHILSKVKFLGQGKYLITYHEHHSDLIYKLSLATIDESAMKNFNLKDHDQFIIQVKNIISFPKLGSNKINTKVKLPKELEKIFLGRKFIPLKPVDFLFYEGVEILLNSRGNLTFFSTNCEIKNYLIEKVDKDLSAI
jgi:hypothetical protein